MLSVIACSLCEGDDFSLIRFNCILSVESMQAMYFYHHAGVPSVIPVMRDGQPYMRNGVPVRIPLQDTTNILEGQEIQRITTMCYVHASKVTNLSFHAFTLLSS